jgi:hypothetical protein
MTTIQQTIDSILIDVFTNCQSRARVGSECTAYIPDDTGLIPEGQWLLP